MTADKTAAAKKTQDNDVKPPDAKVKTLITDKWLKAVKKELAALKHPEKCELQEIIPHVQGCFLGDVNSHRVFAVFADQVMAHCAMDWTTGGNHEKWPFVPRNQLWLSHSMMPDEFQHDGLHEASEQKMMSALGLSYDVAHAHANWFEQEYMKELGVGGHVEDTDNDEQSTKIHIVVKMPWESRTTPKKA